MSKILTMAMAVIMLGLAATGFAQAHPINYEHHFHARTECLDHLLIFNEAHPRRAISGCAAYFNYWRPHRSLGQRAPCECTVHQSRLRGPIARSRLSPS